MNTLYKRIGTVAVAVTLVAAALPAFAQTNPPAGAPQGRGEGRGPRAGMMNGPMMRPGVFGTVSAVNGTTLTVTGKGFAPSSATTTYAVDASNASVTKNGATTTLASVAAGDRVMVQGTVTGTNVVATIIRDGIVMRKPGSPAGWQGSTTTPMQGNGQPVVAGTVSSVSGSSITITTSSNVTYTIDATNAKVTKGNASSAVSSVAAGDYVIVQGTINGTSVTASSVIDQKVKASVGQGSGQGQGNGPAGGIGFFGGIGNFFKKLFGF